MTQRTFAVIAGVGPGTGAALARRFALSYPVYLLARKAESYKDLVEDINKNGGIAIGIETDVSSRDSLENTFKQIREQNGDKASCAAAIFNAGGKLVKKPFLEVTEDEFTAPFAISGRGAFNFAQQALPFMLDYVDAKHDHPPTLIFTGATAALKGSAQFSTLACSKFAQRALAQSLAREFGPKGVHVSHVVVDGVIDLPQSKDLLKDAGPNAKLSPAAIADTYWALHTQPLSALTHEIEIRPSVEKW